MTELRPLDHLPRCELGEGPHWDTESGRLYWVDITGHRIHRWSPADGCCETHRAAESVGFAVVAADGRIVAGLGSGIYAFDFGGDGRELVARPQMDPGNRFNDAACDPRGRLWAGTMHVAASRERPPTGALYRLANGALEEREGGIGISNGLGWSPDGATMYYAETHRGIVWAYDYDLEAGRAGPRRVFAEIPLAVGVPDGLTVDAAGHVFVAVWRGHRIDVFAADGRHAETIRMPVPHATSCCFGGADLGTLFVSTSAEGLSAADRATYPASGLILALQRDVPGIAASRLHL